MTAQIKILDSQPTQNRFLPILNWLPGYDRDWLRGDILAGLTVLALLIPEGMAYAEIAGMPPQTAFYAAPVGLLIFNHLGRVCELLLNLQIDIQWDNIFAQSMKRRLDPVGKVQFFEYVADVRADSHIGNR